MKKLAILGPGLLGGSLALACGAWPGWRVALWARRAAAVEELQARQIVEECSTHLPSIVDGAEVVVLCVPIGAMPALAQELRTLLAPSALVTDVGSVKGPVVAALEGIFTPGGPRFIGSHPMAGSHLTGFAAARADLFQGSMCLVTPTAQTPPGAATEATEFWTRLGCRVQELAPQAHDEVVALISHLPHAVAAALVHTAVAQHPEALELIGPGFRDTTRVAGGPPDMWAEIVRENRTALRQSVEAMIEKLRHFATLLDRSESGPDSAMNEFFTQAKVVRDRLQQPLP